MPSKHYARLLRFERAFAALAAGGRAAAVAQDCGYADRAHMVRDFRAFAAATPGEVLRARLPGEGGLVA